MYVVWVPQRGGRERDVADATHTVPDGRAQHYWDGYAALMRGYRETLDLPVDAWDVYLLYGPDAHWDGAAPPAPRVWMHQLWGARGPAYDPEAFATHARELLRTAGARVAASGAPLSLTYVGALGSLPALVPSVRP